MSNRKTKLNFQTILLSLFGFVLLWAIVTDAWGYSSNLTVKAVISSTIFFVLLHSPAYFVRFYRFGTMDYSTWLIQSVTTAIWGVVFCWLLKKSRTIWNPIIAHIVYDILTGLFVG